MDAKYNAILNDLVNPDKAAEAIISLREHLDADEATMNTLKASNDTLRDVNARLALRVTTPAEVPKDEPVKTDEEIFAELFTKKILEE